MGFRLVALCAFSPEQKVHSEMESTGQESCTPESEKEITCGC